MLSWTALVLTLALVLVEDKAQGASHSASCACWLNLLEGWWRIFRRQALAGQDFADPDEIAHATRVATAQLNARARPWIRGRPQPKPRTYRRRFIYTL
jgi:hypothetical protein